MISLASTPSGPQWTDVGGLAVAAIECLVVAVTAIAAAWAAVKGLNAWRNEIQGRRQYELAEEVLTLAYEARDVIRIMRSPLGRVDEGSTRQPQPGEDKTTAEFRRRAYVPFERFNKNREPFAKLESLRFRLMAVIDPDAAKPIEELRSVVFEVFTAAEMLAEHYWPRQGGKFSSEDEFKVHLNGMWGNEAIFWAHSKDDPIAPKVDDAIARLETICTPILRRA